MPSKDVRALAALAAIWLAIVLAIRPSFAFPLNDDWSFAAMLTNFTQRHVLLPTDVTSMPLVGQIAWAAPFAWLTGSALEGGRLSTLVLGLAGPAALFFGLRRLGAAVGVSILGACALMINPLWISLSCTFMTDVPFTAAAMCATVLFIVAARPARPAIYIAAIACLAWATLIRQMALAFAIGAVALTGWSRPTSIRMVVRAFAPIIVCAGVLAGYSWWLAHGVGLPAMYQRRELEALRGMAALRAHMPGIILGLIATALYAGWGLIPVAPVVVASLGASRVRLHMSIAVVALLIFAAVMALHKMLPVTGNIVGVSGLGALTLPGDAALPALPPAARGIVTLLAIWSALYCAVAIALASPAEENDLLKRGLLFAVLTAASYVAVISQVWVYDRYVLPVIAVAILAALAAPPAATIPRWALGVSIMLVATNAAIGVLGTRDYFAWNTARWMALEDLAREGVPALRIDGGDEYNAATTYDPTRPLGTSGWWNRGLVTYRISFAPLHGWNVVAAYRYRTWLPPSERQLFVLRK